MPLSASACTRAPALPLVAPKNRMALQVKRYGHLLDVFFLDVLVVLVLTLEIETYQLIACSCGILLGLGRLTVK